MVFVFNFSEDERKSLGTTCAALCSILSMAGLALIGIGIYIYVHICNDLSLLKGYDSGLLSHFIIGVGIVMFLLNGAAVKCVYECTSDTNGNVKGFLAPLVFTTFLFVWVIFAAGIFTISHENDVKVALYDGLSDSMKRYKNNLVVKVTIDHMQMRSRCCGSTSYKDWFKVTWVNTDYLNMSDPVTIAKAKEGDMEGVPFSCCDVKARGPCNTRNVTKKGIRNTNKLWATVYHRGCTAVLIEEFNNKILKPTRTALFILFGAQAFAVVLLRYLQTSLQNAHDYGEGTGTGYLFPQSCCPVKISSHRARHQKKYTEDSDYSDEVSETQSNHGLEQEPDQQAGDSLLSRGLENILELMDKDSGGGGSDGSGNDKHEGKTKENSERRTNNKDSKKNDADKKDKSDAKKKEEHKKEKSDKKKDRRGRDKSESKKKSDSAKKDTKRSKKRDGKKRDGKKDSKSKEKDGTKRGRSKSSAKKRNKKGDSKSGKKGRSKQRSKSPGKSKSPKRKVNKKRGNSRARSAKKSKSPKRLKKSSKSPRSSKYRSKSSRTTKSRSKGSKSSRHGSKSMGRSRFGSRSMGKSRFGSRSMGKSRFGSRSMGKSRFGSRSMGKSRFGSMSMGKSSFGSRSMGRSSKGMSSHGHFRRH